MVNILNQLLGNNIKYIFVKVDIILFNISKSNFTLSNKNINHAVYIKNFIFLWKKQKISQAGEKCYKCFVNYIRLNQTFNIGICLVLYLARINNQRCKTLNINY